MLLRIACFGSSFSLTISILCLLVRAVSMLLKLFWRSSWSACSLLGKNKKQHKTGRQETTTRNGKKQGKKKTSFGIIVTLLFRLHLPFAAFRKKTDTHSLHYLTTTGQDTVINGSKSQPRTTASPQPRCPSPKYPASAQHDALRKIDNKQT